MPPKENQRKYEIPFDTQTQFRFICRALETSLASRILFAQYRSMIRHFESIFGFHNFLTGNHLNAGRQSQCKSGRNGKKEERTKHVSNTELV